MVADSRAGFRHDRSLVAVQPATAQPGRHRLRPLAFRSAAIHRPQHIHSQRGLSLEQPYLMLEFFELTANGNVYYRVATEDGLAEIGNPSCRCRRSRWSPASRSFSTPSTWASRYGWRRWRGRWIRRFTTIKGTYNRPGRRKPGDPAGLPASGAGALGGTRPRGGDDQRVGGHLERFHGAAAARTVARGSCKPFCGRSKPRERVGDAREVQPSSTP